MVNFDYQTPTRLIFGKGVVAAKLQKVMSHYGERVLLTWGGGSIQRSGLYDEVKSLLSDKQIFELPGIQPNPKFHPSVLEGVRICQEEQIDVILAVGGGSVLDCTKAIAGVADCINHIMEQFFCAEHIEMNDAFMTGAIRSIIRNVQIVLAEPTNYEARAELFYATTLGCNGIYALGNSESGWPMHAIEHALSAYYDITHGEGLAIVTPRWMRHILVHSTGTLHEQVVERISSFGRQVFGVEGCEASIQAMHDFYRRIGIPMTLPEVGIDESRLDEIAHHVAANEGLEEAWVPLLESDIRKILQDCLNG